MTLYYVFGITMVVGAIVLAAIGLTREGFPPTKGLGRAIIGGTLVVVLGGMGVLLVTTDKEHPRQEAAEAAVPGEVAKAEGATQGEGGGKTVHAVEKEFSIKLDGGDTVKPGKYRFQVVNKGKIEHDLAVEGNGAEEKTALIPPGSEASLEANLAAGTYKLYCTVPGHEQSGMKLDLSVR
jgi:uncharacterized cupredoxin-like copper-binding protein